MQRSLIRSYGVCPKSQIDFALRERIGQCIAANIALGSRQAATSHTRLGAQDRGEYSEVAKLVDNATLSAPWWLDFDNNPRGQLWRR